MKSVVQFSIKQTVLLNVVFVILVITGAFSIFTTPLENMPVVDMGNVFINTVYYGASADDVEQLVTAEIEDALTANLGGHVDLVKEVAGHILFAGGKRLRPLLTVLSARICGYESPRTKFFASIFEYLHAATLHG